MCETLEAMMLLQNLVFWTSALWFSSQMQEKASLEEEPEMIDR